MFCPKNTKQLPWLKAGSNNDDDDDDDDDDDGDGDDDNDDNSNKIFIIAFNPLFAHRALH